MGGTVALLGPVLVALSAAVLALALDAWATPRRAILASAVGALASGILAAVLWRARPGSVLQVYWTGGLFAVMYAVVMLGASVALLAAVDDLAEHPRGGVLAALALLAAAAAAIAPASLDLLALLLAVEVASVCAYAIVALGSHRGAPEAAMKYFIQGSVATAIFLAGTAVLVGGVSGNPSFSAVLRRVAQVPKLAPFALLGLLLVATALSFKAGAFPFHSWVPDAYEMAPTSGAGVLSSAAKSGALLALLVLVAGLGGFMNAVMPLSAIAAASIVFGNLAALKQRSFTRMLAYSGIAQAGYAIVPIAVTAQQGAQGAEGVAPTIFFTATYAIAVAGAFSAAVVYSRSVAGWDGTIDGLAGASARKPVVSGALALLLLSLTGIPPLAGFFGKLYAFKAALVTGLWPLALIGLIGSVVSFGYYGSVLRALYFDAPPDEPDRSQVMSSRWADAAVVAAAALVLVAGVIVLAAGQGLVSLVFGLR